MTKVIVDAKLNNKGFYRTIFRNLPEAIFLVNATTGVIVDTNRQGSVLLGQDCREIIGMHSTALCPSTQADKGGNLLFEQVKKRHSEYESEVIRKDGMIVPVVISASTVTIAGREFILCLFRDITKRKSAEELLKKSEAKYRSLYESSPDGIVFTDSKDRLIDANQAYANMLGYSKKELRKLTYHQLTVPKWRGMEEELMQNQLYPRGYSDEYEKEYIRKDGTVFPVSLKVWLIRNEEGEPVGMWAIVKDITEEKQLRQNLQFYIAEITKAQEEERKRIARDLHDDVAQSLATLSLEIQALAKDKSHPSTQFLKRLEQLRDMTDRTLEQVRRFSHELRPEILDQLGLLPALEFLIEEINKEGKTQAILKVTGLERRLSPETELPLFRIAQEALRNILRHSQATKTEIRVEFDEGEIRMTISDDGKGFTPPKSLGRLTRDGKFGLVSIEERARLIGGTLTVKSASGKGTSVSIVLPE